MAALRSSPRRLLSAMSACCPPTASPVLPCAGGDVLSLLHNGTKLFLAGPATSKAGILAFPNIFGPSSGRTKRDADRLGALGYVVALVDVADGQYPDPSDPRAMEAWNEWMKAQRFEMLEEKVRDALEYLTTKAGATTVSSYGYCWGAWIGASLSASASSFFPTIKGHVSFHPSWVVENLQKGDEAVDKLAEKIASNDVPQLLLSAGDDSEFVKEGGSVERIFKASSGQVGLLSRVVDFPSASHGWVNRGNLEDPTTRENVEKAWELAIEFTKAVNPV